MKKRLEHLMLWSDFSPNTTDEVVATQADLDLMRQYLNALIDVVNHQLDLLDVLLDPES